MRLSSPGSKILEVVRIDIFKKSKVELLEIFLGRKFVYLQRTRVLFVFGVSVPQISNVRK